MNAQTASTVLMIRPAKFGFNPETAGDNFYQQQDERPAEAISLAAQQEFDAMVDQLREKNIQVIVTEDTPSPAKPDAVFPNNWFSTHEDGRLVLYPMRSPIRRKERRRDLVEILAAHGFKVEELVDLTFFEEDGQFLESTGSLVMDRVNLLAYACLSERTHPVPLAYFSRLMSYQVQTFSATQKAGNKKLPIYHTNVMMHIGTYLAVVCLDSIEKEAEKRQLQGILESSGKKIIPITRHQKFAFAGNMLELQNQLGKKFTVMSDTAYQSLKTGQKQIISKYTEIIHPTVPTIEKLGGGSVRCMMAEIFLPKWRGTL